MGHRNEPKWPKGASFLVPVEQAIEESANADGWFHTSDFLKAFRRTTGYIMTNALARDILQAQRGVTAGSKVSNSWRYKKPEGVCCVTEGTAHTERHSRSDVALSYFLRSVEVASKEELANPDRLISDAFAAADAFVVASAEGRA